MMLRLKIFQTLFFKTEFGHIEHQLCLCPAGAARLFRRTASAKSKRGNRVRANAIVNFYFDFNASVLRQTFFRNVELRHNFQTRNQRIAHPHRRVHNVIQNAVNAETNAKIFFIRFDVNIGRAAPQTESTNKTLTNRTTGASSLARASSARSISSLSSKTSNSPVVSFSLQTRNGRAKRPNPIQPAGRRNPIFLNFARALRHRIDVAVAVTVTVAVFGNFRADSFDPVPTLRAKSKHIDFVRRAVIFADGITASRLPKR